MLTLLKKYKLITALVFVIIIWLIIVFVMREYEYIKWSKAAKEALVFPVSIISPKPDTSFESIDLPGNIVAWNQSYIYSRVDGYIQSWYTDYGASVRQGQIMAKVQTPMLRARYGQAKADMKAAEAKYALAALTARRYEAMKDSKAVAIQSISVKDALLKVERAKYYSAKYRVKTLEARLKFRTIIAPFSGIVISRNINLGDYVSKQGSVAEQNSKAGHLFIVADIEKVRLFVSVPERFGSFLKPGFKAKVLFPQYPNKPYTANFLTSAKAFDPDTRTVVTEFVLDNKDHSIWPGSYATVKISAKTRDNILSIPTTAMIFDAKGTRVAVLNKNNTVHYKKIIVSRFKNKTVDIIKGLEKNDRVINNPNLGMLEGSKVEIVNVANGYLD